MHQKARQMEKNVGRVRGVAWCLVVGLGACGLLRVFRGRGLGVAAGPCFAGLSAARGAATLVAPLQQSGGVRGGVVAWADTCAGGHVGVAAFGGVPGARRRPVRGVDRSSVAAASHARTAAASAAMMALQRMRHRRRCRALQHGRPPRASSWRTPHDHAHCLELPVILLSFACIPACLAQALYSR